MNQKTYKNLIHKEERKILREWKSNATEKEIDEGYYLMLATIDEVVMVFTAYMLPTTRRSLDGFFEKDL